MPLLSDGVSDGTVRREAVEEGRGGSLDRVLKPPLTPEPAGRGGVGRGQEAVSVHGWELVESQYRYLLSII